jgi:hypothetical protein
LPSVFSRVQKGKFVQQSFFALTGDKMNRKTFFDKPGDEAVSNKKPHVIQKIIDHLLGRRTD